MSILFGLCAASSSLRCNFFACELSRGHPYHSECTASVAHLYPVYEAGRKSRSKAVVDINHRDTSRTGV